MPVSNPFSIAYKTKEVNTHMRSIQTWKSWGESWRNTHYLRVFVSCQILIILCTAVKYIEFPKKDIISNQSTSTFEYSSAHRLLLMFDSYFQFENKEIRFFSIME